MNANHDGLRFWLVLPALALLSYAVLTFEIALTRIFSVMLNYHFVFAVVSAALLGLGLGAMMLTRWQGARVASAIRTSAVFFALLTVVAVVAIIEAPAIEGGGFWLYLVLAILPFCAAGLAVAGAFQQFASRSAFAYGADLLGAAIGALTIVPLLNLLGGVNAVFFAAAAASVGALLLGLSRGRLPVFATVVCLAIVASFGALSGFRIQPAVPVMNDPDKDMYQMLSNPAFKAKIIESRWSSFGRTDVVKSDLMPNELELFVDGAAGSAMYNSAAVLKDPHEREHLTLHFGEYFPFLFLKDDEKRNALVIGPGGGRDVVVALLGGVKSITAVEVNPDVVKIVKDYKDFNGGIYSGDPRVTPVVAEGRNFVRNSTDRYDLLMLSLPITKSLRSIEGFALTENYLFTVEAFQDYLDHLSTNGRIIIVEHGEIPIYKLIAIALKAFARRGISEQDAMKHIYTVPSDMMPALVIQNQALTQTEADSVHVAMHRLGFDKGPFFIPYEKQVVIPAGARIGINTELRMFDQFLVDISEGRLSMDTLASSASPDIRPVTDNSPFFYKFDRGLPQPFGAFAFLIIAALLTLGYFVLLPKKRGSSPATFRGALREFPRLKLLLLLFSALGAGYMLLEISLFQKLILFIGQPQMALTVLLFSLLLGGGLGSFASSLVHGGGRTVAIMSLAVAIFAVGLSIFFAPLLSLGVSPRVMSMAILVPLGFLMGFPFPTAVRLMELQGFGSHVSVMWGVNGIASVLGSALSMITGIAVGFSLALLLGAILYIGASALFMVQALPESGVQHRVRQEKARM